MKRGPTLDTQRSELGAPVIELLAAESLAASISATPIIKVGGLYLGGSNIDAFRG
jgi:hypothetical protein